MTPLPTDFAPAERSPKQEILNAAGELRNNPLTKVFNTVPVPLLIINPHRQAVFCNSVFQAMSDCDSTQDLLGLRPGEALGCIHANVHNGGCGTSSFCKDCGAAASIIKSLRGTPHTEECRILRHVRGRDEALDLEVFTSPFDYKNNDFILFTAIDIGHEKRKQSLERLFFHDILNLVTGLKYASQMICRVSSSDKMIRQCTQMDRTITQLNEEIQAQKDFIRAEAGKLNVFPKNTSTSRILTHIWDVYTSHPLCADRQVVISEHSENINMETDPVILGRVLGNMIKNALEASEIGTTVTIGANSSKEKVQFWGHNDYVIPEKIQRQIFKRSFSTKGEGRGLGTYSMKLFVENYLGGQISFKSNIKTGTIFSIELPKKLPEIQSEPATEV